MAILLLLDAGAPGELSLDVELDGSTARLRALRAPDSSVLTLPDTAVIPRGWLIPRDDDTQASYTLGPPADAVAVTLEAPLAGAGAALRLLGREFDVKAGVSATLRLRLPAAAPDWSAAHFAEVEVCGRMELDGGAGAFAGVEMCFTVEVDRPPRWEGVELPSIPALRVGLPDVGLRLPPLRLPGWRTLRLPGFPFSLPVPSGTAESPVRAGWRAVSVGADGDAVVLDVAGAWVETALGRVEGDLHLTRTPLRVDPARSWFDLHEPGGARRRLQFHEWHLGDGCVAMQWTQDQLGAWLGLLLPALGDGGARGDSLVTLRLLWGERFEARLDWEAPAGSADPRTLQLPGFALEVPRVAGTSLVVQRDRDGDWVGAVAATLSAGGKVTARTGFGLLQEGVRELTPPRPGAEPAPRSLLEVSLSPNPAATPVPGPLVGFEEPADPEDDPTIPDVPVPGDADDRFTLVLARVDFPRPGAAGLRLPGHPLPPLAAGRHHLDRDGVDDQPERPPVRLPPSPLRTRRGAGAADRP
jgi:hypothetical protein